MTAWLSDETWSQLDPYAGRLRGRSRIVLAVALVVAIGLATGAVAAGRMGLFSPRINANLQEIRAVPSSHAVIETFVLSTSNSSDDRVTGVAAGGPGARAAALTRLPAVIPGSSTLLFTVRITVTDCSAIGDHGLRVVLRLHRFWGTATRTIGPIGSTDQPGIPQEPVLRQICG